MEGGYVDNEEEQGNGGVLWDAHGHRRKLFGGALEKEPAHPIDKETSNPKEEVSMGSFGSEGGCELGRVNIVEPVFYIEKRRGDFVVQSWKRRNWCRRVAVVSKMERPGREPVWCR